MSNLQIVIWSGILLMSLYWIHKIWMLFEQSTQSSIEAKKKWKSYFEKEEIIQPTKSSHYQKYGNPYKNLDKGSYEIRTSIYKPKKISNTKYSNYNYEPKDGTWIMGNSSVKYTMKRWDRVNERWEYKY